jgi:hypothetical protein
MGCCFSATECETRIVRETTRTRSRDCSNIICSDSLEGESVESVFSDDSCTDLNNLEQYDELVQKASKKAKEDDENLENQYKNNYNSILYPRDYLNAESASPDTFYLSSDADVETEGYFCNRPRAYSESKVQPSSSISNSIPGHLGRV